MKDYIEGSMAEVVTIKFLMKIYVL